MKIYLRLAFISFLILTLSSCSNEVDNLTGVIEDAWDNIEDEIEESAEEALEDFADNPEKLYKGDCETDYISFGSIFTLKIPIDYKSRAAIGLLFGSDAAELLSLVEDSKRNSKSKSEVKELILKHFNSSWAGLMTALIVVDGEFDYDFETDDFMDASYDFDSKALYKIMNEKGYFNGGFGDKIPSADEPKEVSNGQNIDSGHKTVHGNVVTSNGKKYPFRIEFDINNKYISNAKYFNPAYSTTVSFNTADIVEGEYHFTGKIGNENLILKYSANYPYSGTLTQGNNTLDVIMDMN